MLDEVVRYVVLCTQVHGAILGSDAWACKLCNAYTCACVGGDWGEVGVLVSVAAANVKPIDHHFVTDYCTVT